jgi:hypothetical protein
MIPEQEQAKALLLIRTEGFSTLRTIRRSARRFFFCILAAIAFLAIGHKEDGWMKFVYIATSGMLCGIMLRDVAVLQRSKNSWSFSARIIDWKKVEALAEGKDLASQAPEAEVRNFVEPRQKVVAQNPSIPPSNLTLPQLLVAGLGFVPLAGLPFALLAVAWGVSMRRRLGAKLAILGAAGPILSLALIASFVSFVLPTILYGTSDNERSDMFLATWLMNAGQAGLISSHAELSA